MKYKKPVFFISGLILMLFALEGLFSVAISNNKYLKLNYVTSNSIDADLVFIGSCEMLTTLSPMEIKKKCGLTSYNLAQNHADLVENYLSLYLYLKNNKAPKYVLQYASPESFDINYNGFNSYRFATFISDEEVKKCIKKFDYNYWFASKFPFGRFAFYNSKFLHPAIQGMKHVVSRKSKPYFKDGYEPFFKIWENSINKYQETYKSDVKFFMNNERMNYLEKSIELCKSKNIQFILLETPMFKYANLGNREEIKSKIQDFANAKNVPFYCFDTMKICFEKKNFMSNFEPKEIPSSYFNSVLGELISDNN